MSSGDSEFKHLCARGTRKILKGTNQTWTSGNDTELTA